MAVKHLIDQGRHGVTRNVRMVMQKAGVQLNRLVEVLGLDLHHRGGDLVYCRCLLESLRRCLYRRSRNIFTTCNLTEVFLSCHHTYVTFSTGLSYNPVTTYWSSPQKAPQNLPSLVATAARDFATEWVSRDFHVLLTLKTSENYLLPRVAGNFYTNKLQPCRQKDKFLETVVNSALFVS